MLRKIVDPARLDFDYPKQRLFCDDRLVAYHSVSSEALQFKNQTLAQLIPTFRPEQIEEARAAVKKEREDRRARQ